MSLIDDLHAILAAAVAELAYDPPALAFVAPGAQVAWDECCEGQLWVRVVKAHPVNPVPTKAFPVSECTYPIGVQVGIGVIRCQTGLDALDQGAIPTPAQMTADADRMVCDMAALHRVLCEAGWLIDQWTPLGPSGGCYGGEWTAWPTEVDLPDCGEESE